MGGLVLGGVALGDHLLLHEEVWFVGELTGPSESQGWCLAALEELVVVQLEELVVEVQSGDDWVEGGVGEFRVAVLACGWAGVGGLDAAVGVDDLRLELVDEVVVGGRGGGVDEDWQVAQDAGLDLHQVVLVDPELVHPVLLVGRVADGVADVGQLGGGSEGLGNSAEVAAQDVVEVRDPVQQWGVLL